ncbi:hypothetical protein YC2023_055741 [Brassica napus]
MSHSPDRNNNLPEMSILQIAEEMRQIFVDLPSLLEMNPLSLTPSVLLSLLLHLAGDINKDTSCKLAWMTCVASICGPSIFEQISKKIMHPKQRRQSFKARHHVFAIGLQMIQSLIFFSSSCLFRCL